MTTSKVIIAKKRVAVTLAIVVSSVLIHAFFLNLAVLAADEVVYQGTVKESSREVMPPILGSGRIITMKLAEYPDKMFQMPEDLAIQAGILKHVNQATTQEIDEASRKSLNPFASPITAFAEAQLRNLNGKKVKISSGPASGMMSTDVRTKQTSRIYPVTKIELVK